MHRIGRWEFHISWGTVARNFTLSEFVRAGWALVGALVDFQYAFLRGFALLSGARASGLRGWWAPGVTRLWICRQDSGREFGGARWRGEMRWGQRAWRREPGIRAKFPESFGAGA